MVGRLLICVAVLLGGQACRTRDQLKPAKDAAEALSRLQRALKADQLDRVWELMDQGSRWSAMSAYKDQRKTCELVRAHYPKQRQVSELRRCRAAEVAADAKAYFVALARQDRQLMAPVARFKAPGKQVGAGQRVSLDDGNTRLEFCKGDEGWAYCGLQGHFDQLKVKAARDLDTVQENIEAFK